MPARPGQGRLTVERSGSRSVITHAFATSPLGLLTPGNHGHAAWIYTSHFGGGLVDGDQIDLDLEVGQGAAAFVSTQASTKVYRSRRGASVELNARIGADGLLIMAPDPVVCFGGARYRQVQRFQVCDRGALLVIDCLSSGRRAAGERWAFSECCSITEVSVDNRLLVYESLALRASDGDLVVRMGRFHALALVVIVGDLLEQETQTLVATTSEQPVARCSDQLISALPLAGHGCILRIAATSVEQVARTLRERLRFVAARLGDDPWSRKW